MRYHLAINLKNIPGMVLADYFGEIDQSNSIIFSIQALRPTGPGGTLLALLWASTDVHLF